MLKIDKFVSTVSLHADKNPYKAMMGVLRAKGWIRLPSEYLYGTVTATIRMPKPIYHNV